jgi:hypothetical protein
MISDKWFRLKIYYLRKEKKIFSILYKKLKKFDDKFKSNFDYRFIKEISILILDLYINYKMVQLIFWTYFIIEYFEIEVDIRSMFLWYYYVMCVVFWILYELIWTLFYYKTCLYIQLILIFETYFLIKYLLWCLFFHPHLYAITLGIVIGFVISHGIFIKFYKVPFTYQRLWALNIEKALKRRKNWDKLLWESNEKWQVDWYYKATLLWAYRNNYKILKKDYEELNKVYLRTVIELNRAKRQIVRNRQDEYFD